MPELPEVETTLKGIEPHLKNQTIAQVLVRNPGLRWPVPTTVARAQGQKILRLTRRAKYLLIELSRGGLILHLGMSGSLRILTEFQPPQKHDHIDLVLKNGVCMRFNDPRRFGAFLWTDKPFDDHPLLCHLGPEPLSRQFNARYLHNRSRGRKVAIKNFIMNGRVVTGIGNIYASEALYMAGIHPARAAGKISLLRYNGLADAIVDVLNQAIRQGGTSLRDFVHTDGAPGYFAQHLLVYDRAGKACFQCGAVIHQKTIGQRSSYYCCRCQH